MTDTNHIAGIGFYSHEVPSAVGRVVLIRDGTHYGTEVYRTEQGFRFVSLDQCTVHTAERCVLVRLRDVSTDELSEPYGCDLDSPDGVALIGCYLHDQVPGEILWDSNAT